MKKNKKNDTQKQVYSKNYYDNNMSENDYKMRTYNTSFNPHSIHFFVLPTQVIKNKKRDNE